MSRAIAPLSRGQKIAADTLGTISFICALAFCALLIPVICSYARTPGDGSSTIFSFFIDAVLIGWPPIAFGIVPLLLINSPRNPALIATMSGAISTVSAVVYSLFLIVMISSLANMSDGPPFRVHRLAASSFLLYGSPAVLCTLISLILVGPSRCRLAWLSFCTYVPAYLIIVHLANAGFLIRYFP